MSGPRLARPVGWNPGRAGCGACVAGAHLALSRLDGSDANKRLVFRALPRGTVEFYVAPSFRRCAGGVNGAGGDIMVPQVYWIAGDEPPLRPGVQHPRFRPEEGEMIIYQALSEERGATWAS